jgi:hypothetical protein
MFKDPYERVGLSIAEEGMLLGLRFNASSGELVLKIKDL